MKIVVVNSHRNPATATLTVRRKNFAEITSKKMPPFTQATVDIGNARFQDCSITSKPAGVVTIHPNATASGDAGKGGT